MDGQPAELEKEYREAIYAVFADEKEIIFRIGEISNEVEKLLTKNNTASFAFITAYNPRSQVLPDSENKARQQELKKSLSAENFKFLEGYGANEREVWQREESLFIFDISLEKAVEIGREFEQNAILYRQKDEEIKLIWCFEE